MLKINKQTTLLSIFALVASCSFLQAGFRGPPYSRWSPWIYGNNTAPQFSLALPIAIADDVTIKANFVQLKGVHVRGTITVDGCGLGCGADKPTMLLLSSPLDVGVEGREIADCRYRTIVYGDIIFVGSRGEVIVEEGAIWLGKVINGSVSERSKGVCGTEVATQVDAERQMVERTREGDSIIDPAVRHLEFPTLQTYTSDDEDAYQKLLDRARALRLEEERNDRIIRARSRRSERRRDSSSSSDSSDDGSLTTQNSVRRRRGGSDYCIS